MKKPVYLTPEGLKRLQEELNWICRYNRRLLYAYAHLKLTLFNP